MMMPNALLLRMWNPLLRVNCSDKRYGETREEAGKDKNPTGNTEGLATDRGVSRSSLCCRPTMGVRGNARSQAGTVRRNHLRRIECLAGKAVWQTRSCSN